MDDKGELRAALAAALAWIEAHGPTDAPGYTAVAMAAAAALKKAKER